MRASSPPVGRGAWPAFAGTGRRAAGIIGAICIALSAAAPPAGAQQREEAARIAADVNRLRSKLYEQHDVSGVAAVFTADARYVELMPVLVAIKGRDQIKARLEQVIDAAAERIVPCVQTAETNADGTIFVAGDYVVVSRIVAEDDALSEPAGHFVQTLRREQDGAWRIALHVFARAGALTAAEAELYP